MNPKIAKGPKPPNIPFGAAATPAARDSEPETRLAIPDHELLRRIGRGAYGEVWLARNQLGAYRAVKVVYRKDFEQNRPFEREFAGIQSDNNWRISAT